MSKKYAFILYKNLHTKPHEDRQSGKWIETTWDQLEPIYDTIEAAKLAAGNGVVWNEPLAFPKPSWDKGDSLPQYGHYSADGEWYIFQEGVKTE